MSLPEICKSCGKQAFHHCKDEKCKWWKCKVCKSFGDDLQWYDTKEQKYNPE